uniref:ABC transporter, ATPase component n=1 Tax=Magnetococcus massalia (strain MO-1) TaxID=451514 RepID=A0A1S7LK89_MAGMO|nr:ABC transporter, ATPase component [Candidatus Magnetococcus massalia]
MRDSIESAQPPALTIQGLVKRYGNGVLALDGIDLQVAQGELFAILGPNGAGKSTLINIIAQVTGKSEGQVQLFGVDLDRSAQQAKLQVGITPQEIALDPFFTVREVLINHAGYYGERKPHAYVDHLLEQLGLTEHADKRTRQLSGGMKRRLTVAKSLVHKPQLIILDEPTAGVDVALRRDLWAFVRQLHQDGVTVILTTHYLEEAQELAERVAIINQGKLIACERTDKLLATFGSRRIEIQWQPGSPEPAALPQGLQWRAEEAQAAGNLKEAAIPELLAWAAQQGGAIRDLRMEPPRLEDVYLQLTGEAS